MKKNLLFAVSVITICVVAFIIANSVKNTTPSSSSAPASSSSISASVMDNKPQTAQDVVNVVYKDNETAKNLMLKIAEKYELTSEQTLVATNYNIASEFVLNGNPEKVREILNLIFDGKTDKDLSLYVKDKFLEQGAITEEQLNTFANLSFTPYVIYCMEDDDFAALKQEVFKS